MTADEPRPRWGLGAAAWARTTGGRQRAGLVADLHRRQPFLAIINASVGVMAALAMRGHADGRLLLGWAALMVASQAARVLHHAALDRRARAGRDTARPERWLVINSAVSGGCWGLFGTLFADVPDTFGQTLVPFVLAGMTGSAVAALAPLPPAFLAFVLTAILPFTARLMVAAPTPSPGLAGIAVVYVASITFVALQLHRSFRRAAKLHTHNLRLVRHLERSRLDLEQRVEQRTVELRTANEALIGEVSQRRRSEQRVRHLLAHDPLTNLPNRLLLSDRLHQALVRACRYGGVVGVLAFDLDRFKEINDTHGHPTGDAVLRELAARVCAIVRATDTPARIGGDEFALVAPDLSDAAGAVRLAEKLLEACRAPVEAAGVRVQIGISVGIALFPEHGQEVDDLLTGADLALYAAKAAGRGRWSMFSAETRAAAHARRRVEAELREAVVRGDQLRLVYQPRFSLTDNRLVAAEALLRWQHPERGLLTPRDFIDVAETSGIIREIGRWVLREAAGQARRWRDAGSPLRVSVNLSAVEFRQPDLPEQIGALLEEAGLEPELLELEITESVYMDQRAAGLEDELRRVKDLGVALAVDDFGTGYSSLAYLRWVPFDVLKIDRTFVTNLVEDHRDEAIVRTIVALARNLDKKVVAEGVEMGHQLAALRRLGCHEGQGYLLGRPAPPETMRNVLVA